MDTTVTGIGSVVVAAILYIMVQFAFIGSLNPAMILHYHTWANLANNAGLEASPFYTLTVVAGLGWLAWILKADSAVSPGACGLVYLTTSARLSYGMSREGYLPTTFAKTSKRERIPWFEPPPIDRTPLQP